ncbi:MAG: SAM-dependent methyltransferase, partial [Terriglobia bacterium]
MAARAERRTPLTDILLKHVEREGPLTFAAYMQACLYHPEHGYYTSHVPRTGRRDYYTSVEVGPLFARLLARQAREMSEALGRPARFDLVECGAGRGRLARELVGAVREQWPPFAQALRVTLVEASAALRAKAAEAAKLFGDVVRIVPAMPAAPIAGCILSNELVDALPVHRVVQREDGLREIWITAKEGELCEQEGQVSSARVASYLEQYGAPLAVGQIAEVHLAALDWLERAARCLERGFILTID